MNDTSIARHRAHADFSTSGGDIAIEAIDLVKDYGEGDTVVHALRGVNVRFARGRFTAIMGPSGSGKSTLMHTLAGLDAVTGGHILFGGRDLTDMNDNELTMLRRHRIGFIFQSFNLLPMFTAEQNILMPLTQGRPRVVRHPGRHAGARPAAEAPPQRAFRRPAAARCHRQGARHQTRPGVRRRADRQPRLGVERRSARLPETFRT